METIVLSCKRFVHWLLVPVTLAIPPQPSLPVPPTFLTLQLSMGFDNWMARTRFFSFSLALSVVLLLLLLVNISNAVAPVIPILSSQICGLQVAVMV